MARLKQLAEAEASVEPIGETGLMAGGVGGTLRDARERHGWTIAQVAQQLRIRAPVLEAMEAGSFEKLPNGAYALGFVRSYADFLGLDRDEIARRVKAEAAALNARTELIFPKPIRESRMPSGIVLLVSVALAVTGYGLWYYNSSGVRVAAPRVEAVPERLGGAPERAAKSPSNAAAATAAEPTVAAPTAASDAPKPEVKAEMAPPSVPAPATAAPVSSPAPAPQAPPVAAAPSPAPPPPAPASTPAAEPQVAALPAIPPAPAPATSAAVPETRLPASPKQYGDTDGNARIVIKATADSWVQIRDRTGGVIFSRILRTGDSYGVADRPGQTLTTGSAGVLEFVVDGKKAPTIGRPGFTQHDVPLDPARLLAGTAVTEPKPTSRSQRPAAPSPAPAAEPQPAAPSPSPGTDG